MAQYVKARGSARHRAARRGLGAPPFKRITAHPIKRIMGLPTERIIVVPWMVTGSLTRTRRTAQERDEGTRASH